LGQVDWWDLLGDVDRGHQDLEALRRRVEGGNDWWGWLVRLFFRFWCRLVQPQDDRIHIDLLRIFCHLHRGEHRTEDDRDLERCGKEQCSNRFAHVALTSAVRCNQDI
jgi:hypothetical protein